MTKSMGLRKSQVHLGLTVREGPKYGLRINRDTYANISKTSSHFFPRELDPALWESQAHRFEDLDHRIYTDEWCEEHQKHALENFDINMARFSQLDTEEFNHDLARVLEAHPKMVEVTDLNEWEEGNAIYMMVLDDYKQTYIGIARSAGGAKERIRKHWNSNKQFDRLLYGTIENSIISIDSFRALDTTRVFAMKHKNPERIENQVLEIIPSKFVLNRIAGGTPTNINELNGLDLMRFLHVNLNE